MRRGLGIAWIGGRRGKEDGGQKTEDRGQMTEKISRKGENWENTKKILNDKCQNPPMK